MFNKYYLVELTAYNQTKTIRSNCVLKSKLFQKPPLQYIFENCKTNGYPSVNILSVTQVNKKTAEYLKDHINSKTNNLVNPSDISNYLTTLVKSSGSSMESGFDEKEGLPEFKGNNPL